MQTGLSGGKKRLGIAVGALALAWMTAAPGMSAQNANTPPDVGLKPAAPSSVSAPASTTAPPAADVQAPTTTAKNSSTLSNNSSVAQAPLSSPTCAQIHAAPEPAGPTQMQTLPAGTRITMVLDTPISTRISEIGQVVEFKVASPYLVEGREAIAAGTVFNGRIIGVQRPGSFSRNGEVRVVMESVALPGGPQTLSADLQPTDPKASFSGKSDSPKTLGTVKKVAVVAEGALIGAQIGGGQGALIGAGAGGTVLLIIGLSKHGRDVYLEPGTPFDVVLRSPLAVSLSHAPSADCKHDAASANDDDAAESAETSDGAPDNNVDGTSTGTSNEREITPRSVPQPPL